MNTPEHKRLAEAAARTKHWRRWGPYVSERQWGTVREDYSADGDAWSFVTHDMARSYAYRWGEEGIAGFSDNHQRLCFALALWNGRDSFLKERLFGLTNAQGNHGEDVKECYWHLDATPTHSYMEFVYRYPQRAFPYEALIAENARRGRGEPEFELADTGVLEEGRFFDITVTYAKADADDVLVRIEVVNRGPEAAVIHVLPTVWFRNDWKWSEDAPVPSIVRESGNAVRASHATLGERHVIFSGEPVLLFTDNETNIERLYGVAAPGKYFKDGINDYVVLGKREAVRDNQGTKCAAHYEWALEPGETKTIKARLTTAALDQAFLGGDFDEIIRARKAEADLFYESTLPATLSEERRTIARRAFDGMLWSKQWYHYAVDDWLKGDATMPAPPPERRALRNSNWTHLYNDDILSMPDKWEYPWFAVWDSAFHAVTLALVDPDYAKRQLELLTREWYMHPNGQLPAYEWCFDDVNPPVHAWATWRVYRMEKARTGRGDTDFLESVFHKLLMNFTWWVNRKDPSGQNLFHGGFLGMDNIGAFDRSAPVPTGGHLEQSDGTSWMALYCLNMLAIAWELAKTNRSYEDIASKFFEHFLQIADAIHNIEDTGQSLWDKTDGFFYDQIHFTDGRRYPLRIRSMVGLVPLFAIEIIDYADIDDMPGFKRRMDWFYRHRPDLTKHVLCAFSPGRKGRCVLSLLHQEQLRRLLQTMLDSNEFLSEHGIRSLSKYHKDHPYVFEWNDYRSEVGYEPGESLCGLFGGNSNWRGPVWFPVNFMIVEALRRYYDFFGDSFAIECPTGSGTVMNLKQVADELTRRLIALFERKEGRRPAFGDAALLQDDLLWREHALFHEYFHGDTGKGLGASHQTGWTGLVANLLVEER